MVRIFENHKLELFSLHSFWTNLLILAIQEKNFRTSLTKSIYEINVCKSQYKKDLRKILRVNAGLFPGG